LLQCCCAAVAAVELRENVILSGFHSKLQGLLLGRLAQHSRGAFLENCLFINGAGIGMAFA
jgi:hypothetical protein